MRTSILDEAKQSSPFHSWGKLPIPIWLFLFAIVFPAYFHVGPLNLNGMRLLLIVLFIPLFTGILTGKYGRILWTDILFFLFILWVGISMAFSNPDRLVEYFGATSIEFFGGYLLGRAYVRSLETFISVVRALIFVIVASIPFAFYENFTGVPVVIDAIGKLPGLSSFDYGAPSYRFGLNRAQVFLPHPISYGLFASIGISLCFVGLKDIVKTPVRYVLVALMGLSVFLAVSSAPILSVLLQFCLIAWAWMFSTVRNKWFILVAVLVSLYVFVDVMSNRTPLRVFMSYATFSPHNAYWRASIFDWGMVNVWNNPIFGLGLRDWVRPSWMYSPSIDNFWLLIAMRHGIPAFLLLASGYLLALWQVGRRELPDNAILRNARLGWMFTFVGLSFVLSTVHVWSTIFSFVFFLFGAGLWFLTEEGGSALENDEMVGPNRERKLRYSRMTLLGAQSARSQEKNSQTPPLSSGKTVRLHRDSGRKIKVKDTPKYSRFQDSPDGNDEPN